LSDTPVSLLERLRLRPDSASWQRLVDLYTPLIRDWLRRQAVQPADIDDLTQDILGTVARELHRFRHDLRRGAFRRWLRTVTVNRLRNFWRAARVRPTVGGAAFEEALEHLADPDSDLSRIWDEEHDSHVVRRLLQLIEPEFEPTTWRAFRLLVLDGLPAREVASALDLSANAVRIAKSRVLSRFRQEIEGLVD
jgi:RNA polymerase sigma-70 factor, ECF subfamily